MPDEEIKIEPAPVDVRRLARKSVAAFILFAAFEGLVMGLTAPLGMQYGHAWWFAGTVSQGALLALTAVIAVVWWAAEEVSK